MKIRRPSDFLAIGSIGSSSWMSIHREVPRRNGGQSIASSVDGTGGPLAAGSVTHSTDGALEGAALADPSATDLQLGESLTASYTTAEGGGEADGSWYLLVRRSAESSGVIQGEAGSAAQLPARFGLMQNAPNPFGATTAIEFAVPHTARVKIEVFDLLGRRIRTLTDQSWPAGRHAVTWDRTTDRGERLSSGVFVYRMTAGEFRDRKKLVIGAR